MLDDEDPVMIGVGAGAGVLIPTLLSRYRPSKATVTSELAAKEKIKDPAIASSLILGAGGLGAALLGQRDIGPLADNDTMINASAALGASSLFTGVGLVLYPAQEKAQEAGYLLGPATEVAAPPREVAEEEASVFATAPM